MSTSTTVHMHKAELQEDRTTLFGFWLYLMTDVILFAALFATFAVLREGTAGGPSGREIFSLPAQAGIPLVAVETLLLLTSSFTCGIALLAARAGNKAQTLFLLGTTVLLGAGFVAIEGFEFAKLVGEGFGPARSGFLSGYFALVGTHGLHVSAGLIWMLALMLALYFTDLSRSWMRKLLLMSLFWHFLDIVWIFIFTFVYLLAV